MSIDALVIEIAAAWKNHSPVSAEEIRYKPEGTDFEHDDVVSFFAGKRWSDVTWKELMKYEGDRSACLSFMTPLAYQNFLPSYMLIALRDYDESDVTAESAWWSLTPTEDPSRKKWWQQRTNRFSPEQCQVIVGFLEFMLSEHGEDYSGEILAKLRSANAYWSSL